MNETTYIQALNEIEELKKKAADMRIQELGPTIERFKKAISVYGISPLDVFSAMELSGYETSNQPFEQSEKAFQTPVTQAAHQAVTPAVTRVAQPAFTASDNAGHIAVSTNPKPGGSVAQKYTDGQGNTWSGRGRNPLWFLAAIASGVSPESLLIVNANSSSPVIANTTPAAVSVKANPVVANEPRVPVAPKYVSDTGSTWSGRGRQPQWFIDATASGKTAESLLIAQTNSAPTASAAQGAQLMQKERAKREAMTAAAQASAQLPVAVKAPRKTGPGYRFGELSWTGVGPRPAWFKNAIAAGKTLEELRA